MAKKARKISHPKKAAMIEALEQSLGVVTTAAKKVGIARRTHYDWMDADPDYSAEVHDLSNMAIDFAESQLFKQIKDGNTTATIFYLKTKAKARGYVERQEIDHSSTDGSMSPRTLDDWYDEKRGE